MTSDTITEIGEFFTMWTTYQKVLENNHMHHQEIYQAVGELLRKQLADRPFNFLDLGCGDASFIARALQDTAVTSYTGYDLSDPALAQAANNISPLGCVANLINADFMSGLAETTKQFDVIFASYAVHHLNFEEKAKFFALAKQALTENGFVLMVDVMREPSESLAVYLDNYCQWMTETWTSLNPQEISDSRHHVSNYDIAETAETLQVLAEVAGFKKTTIVHQLPWHKTLLFCI